MSHRSLTYATKLRWIWLPRLRRRTLFVIGGLTVGLAAMALAFLADEAQRLFSLIQHHWPYLPLLLTPTGFAFLVWLTRSFVPGAQGSGIPQVMAARQLQSIDDKHRLVSPKLSIAKMILLSGGLLVGASAGREGPTVQIGASIMFCLGRISPHRQPGLLLAGGAAGVAAAFNAPLAGIVFAIEEMSRSFEIKTSGLVLSAVIVAGLVPLAIVGDYTYFGRSEVALVGLGAWPWIVVLGIVCGLFGGLFSRLVIGFAHGVPGRIGTFIKVHPIAFAAACGLGVAVCGALSDGGVFGTSAEQAKAIMAGESVAIGFGALKFLATLLSSVSGIPGGIFSPSLAVGAGVADMFSALVPIPIAALTIICMGSYLAAVLQAPITAFVIVTEMTGNHSLIFPLMVGSVVATSVSRVVCKEGIYHALARQLLVGSGSSKASQ